MKGKNSSLISIGIPVYNGETFLKKAVASILSQNYKNIEIIISNDCSTDNSFQILQKFAQKDKRIKLFNQKTNLGLAANYNFVLSKAKGDYFMWAAQDDVRDKTTVTKLLQLLEERKDAVVAASNYKNVFKNKSYFVYKKMEYDNNINHVGSIKKFLEYDHISFLFGLYKTAILKKTKGHHADFRPYFKSSDFLTILKVLMYGSFVYTSEVLFFKQDTGNFTNQFDVIKSHNFSRQIIHRIFRYLYSPFFYILDFVYGTKIIFISKLSFLNKSKIFIYLTQNILYKFSLFIKNLIKGLISFLQGILRK